MFETLIAEPLGHAEGPHAVVAEDDEVLVGVEFLIGAGGNVAHGHGDAAGDMGGLEFPWFAHIDEAGLVIAEKRCGVGGGDFVVEHEFSLEPAGREAYADRKAVFGRAR